MRRVSSRQRLVSWDAFDASAPESSSSSSTSFGEREVVQMFDDVEVVEEEDDDAMSDYITAAPYDEISPSSRRSSLVVGSFGGDLDDEDDDMMDGRTGGGERDVTAAVDRHCSHHEGVFAIDLGDDDDDGAEANDDAAAVTAHHTRATLSPSSVAVAGSKRDRYGGAAASFASSLISGAAAAAAGGGGGGGGMRKSVSFSGLPSLSTASSSSSLAAAAMVTASRDDDDTGIARRSDRGGGTLSEHAGHIAATNVEACHRSSVGQGHVSPFPALFDPTPVPMEDDDYDDEDDDDYGRPPALSSLVAVLRMRGGNPTTDRRLALSPPHGDGDDDDDYGRPPIAVSPALSSSSRPGKEGEGPLLPDEDDDDDYGKSPILSSAASLVASMSDNNVLAPLRPPPRDGDGAGDDDDDDDDDYGKMPALSLAAAASSSLPARSRTNLLDTYPLRPEEDADDGDDYGVMPSVLSNNGGIARSLLRGGSFAGSEDGTIGSGAIQQQTQVQVKMLRNCSPSSHPLVTTDSSIPRNESEMSLGLRYMTPFHSTADLGSLAADAQSLTSPDARCLSPSSSQCTLYRRGWVTTLQYQQQHRSALFLPPVRVLDLTSLADDALLRILSYLPPYDVRRTSESCRSLRSVVSGEDGRYLWTDMMSERWPTLCRIADRASGAHVGTITSGAGGFGGLGPVHFVDGVGIATAGLDRVVRGGQGAAGQDAGGVEPEGHGEDGIAVPVTTAGREERAAAAAGPNLSVLLAMSALRSPACVDPYHHAATPHRIVDFRSFDMRARWPEDDDDDKGINGDDDVTLDAGRPGETELWEGTRGRAEREQAEGQRIARRLLASAGSIPVVQFTGRVGTGDRCVRSDAPLARPSSSSINGCGGCGNGGAGASAVGRASLSGSEGGSLSGGGGFGGGSSPLSSSPTARMMEFLRRRGICVGDRELGESTPRPFVSPFVATSLLSIRGEGKSLAATTTADGVAATVDLTPRLVAYFEVSILPRDEAQEPPTERDESDNIGRAAAAHPPRVEMERPRAVTMTTPHLHPHQHIPTVHFHHHLMPLPLPIPPPQPHPRLLPRPRVPAARHGQGAGTFRSSLSSDCIAVGLSTRSFLAHRRMPGWDRHSYGYHGDDGGIFHSSGEMERIFGPTYGPGDTVGCGVNYLNGGIFFTLNGKFLGYAWTDLKVLKPSSSGGSDGPGGEELYPTVGVDSKCPVACNFGEREFAFDLSTFVRQGEHGDAVRRALGGLVCKNEIGERDCQECVSSVPNFGAESLDSLL